MARHVSSWTEYHPNYASGLELDKLVCTIWQDMKVELITD